MYIVFLTITYNSDVSCYSYAKQAMKKLTDSDLTVCSRSPGHIRVVTW